MILTSYVLLVVVAASAAARSSRCGTCTPKLQRKAWYDQAPTLAVYYLDTNEIECRHTLTDNEKLSYIEAELCLMDKEATLGLPGAKNMFEELQATHQLQAGITHNVVRTPLPYKRERPLPPPCLKPSKSPESNIATPANAIRAPSFLSTDSLCSHTNPFSEKNVVTREPSRKLPKLCT